jgi:hypothetical protein
MVLSKPPSVSLTLKRPLSLPGPVPLSKKAKEDCEQKKQKIHVLEEDEENFAHNNGNFSMFIILLLYYISLFYLYYFIKVI